MRQLKVLHVYKSFYPETIGGVETAILEIADATAKLGVEPRLFVLARDARHAERRYGSLSVVRGKALGKIASCDIGSVSAILLFRRLCKDVDVVHFHFPWPFGDILNLFRPRNTRAIVTYHSDIVRQKKLKAIYRPLMRSFLGAMDVVVATSPNYVETSEDLRSYVKKSCLNIIPLGMRDHTQAPPPKKVSLTKLGIAEDEEFIVFIGVPRYYKGLVYLIEASTQLNCKVVIAGDGPELSGLKRYATDLNARQVLFCGAVDDETKSALLYHSSVVILPSTARSEAFGMVLLEASMFGKPMVSCEIGSGTSYVNIDQVTGYVVSPGSPEEIASSVKLLTENPEIKSQMGSAARKRYEQLFSSAVLAKEYISIYRKILLRSDILHSKNEQNF